MQKPSQVLIRQPGERSYDPAVPARPSAVEQWEYAALSDLVYPSKDELQVQEQKKQRRDEAVQRGVPDDPCVDFEPLLYARGWRRWNNFPADEPGNPAKTQAEQVNLGVQVWQNDSVSPAVTVVVFRGTEFTSLWDWKSNLRWFIRFIPGYRDEYTVAVENIGPQFVEQYGKNVAPGTGGRIVAATGHSLGAGLAQQLAYSRPPDPTVPDITRIYAFDPSPVTGYFSVSKALRDQNAQALVTARIFEKGEILAYLRWLVALVVPPSKEDPKILSFRYNLFPDRGPIADHSIHELACRLYVVATDDARVKDWKVLKRAEEGQ
ncbi:MAG: hypothetical protein JO269_03450 [Burkholderiaceae bacterium]|nr:hypothetical protein [Burkholderiaceae bacterium]